MPVAAANERTVDDTSGATGQDARSTCSSNEPESSSSKVVAGKESSEPAHGLPRYDDFPQDVLEVRQTALKGRGIYVKRGAKVRRGERPRETPDNFPACF